MRRLYRLLVSGSTCCSLCSLCSRSTAVQAWLYWALQRQVGNILPRYWLFIIRLAVRIQYTTCLISYNLYLLFVNIILILYQCVDKEQWFAHEINIIGYTRGGSGKHYTTYCFRILICLGSRNFMVFMEFSKE